MAEDRSATVGNFLVWLLLGLVTFGIYPSWWMFSRLETIYRGMR